MSRSYFVRPETVRLDLFGGDEWIEAKKLLSYGEEQRLAGAALGKASGLDKGSGAEIALDMERYGIERIATWVENWSLGDESGRAVRLTRAAISNLDPVVADEINRVLEEHIEAVEAEKKLRSGSPRPAGLSG